MQFVKLSTDEEWLHDEAKSGIWDSKTVDEDNRLWTK